MTVEAVEKWQLSFHLCCNSSVQTDLRRQYADILFYTQTHYTPANCYFFWGLMCPRRSQQSLAAAIRLECIRYRFNSPPPNAGSPPVCICFLLVLAHYVCIAKKWTSTSASLWGWRFRKWFVRLLEGAKSNDITFTGCVSFSTNIHQCPSVSNAINAGRLKGIYGKPADLTELKLT